MSNLTISLWEVVEATELPPNLPMTIAMSVIRRGQKARISPHFLEFLDAFYVFVGKNAEHFKDDFDFLKQMMSFGQILSENKTAILDLLLPHYGLGFFLNEVVAIASKYNIIMLVEGLELAFLPNNVIYPIDALNKWHEISNKVNPVIRFKKFEALQKWAKDKVTHLLSQYDFKPVSDDFPRLHMYLEDGFYYQRETPIGMQLVGIELYKHLSTYDGNVFHMRVRGVIYATEVLAIFDKFNLACRDIDRHTLYYRTDSREGNNRLEVGIRTKADFYQAVRQRIQTDLLINIMNIGISLEGLKMLDINMENKLIIHYLSNALSYETQCQLFARGRVVEVSGDTINSKIPKLYHYLDEQRINKLKE